MPGPPHSDPPPGPPTPPYGQPPPYAQPAPYGQPPAPQYLTTDFAPPTAPRFPPAVAGISVGVRAAAARTTGAMHRFALGLGAYWLGLARLVVSPVLWLFVLAPVAVGLGVYFGVVALLYHLVDPILGWLTGFMADWPDQIRDISRRGIAWWATRSVRGWARDVLLPVSVIVGAFGYVLTVRRIERRLGEGPGAARQPYGSAVLAATARTALLLGVSLLLWLPVYVVGLLPVVKPFVFVFEFFLSGFLFGWLFWTIPLGHYGITRFAEQWRACWYDRAYLFGLGGMYFLVDVVLSFTPFDWLAFATTPAAFVGGALLYRRARGLPTRRPRPTLVAE